MGAARLAAILLGLTLIAAPAARGENWIWVSAEDGVSLDADSIFVDRVTGFIAFNSATDVDGDGDFIYSAIALDCTERRYFHLGGIAPGSRQNVKPGWLIDPARQRPLRKGSVAELAAEYLCPQRASLRNGSIE
jgi:hypothetical protein